ncbi:MAG: hypothetical protein AB202_02120 [Parcubacteria bacterium C7867-007]|nr:MAG: hypothetical protein AB202_02120 [Parcubacteria bacterium C7867-007]
MKQQDFTKRLTIVVRTDIESWQGANTIAHIAGYVGNKLGEAFDTGTYFITADGVELPRNSQYPMIIKAAQCATDIRDAYDIIRTHDLIHIGFIREMIETSDDSEIETILKDKKHKDIELLGFGVFGENETVKELTKQFTLWK